MRLPWHDSANSVIGRIVAAGATPGVAEEIVGALLGCGLTAAEAREWLEHPRRAYPIGDRRGILLSNTPLAMVQAGDADFVRDAAQEFADASPDERAIARRLGGDIEGARRLTGGRPDRARAIAELTTTMLERLGKPERVCFAAQTRLPGRGDRRIVDRLLAGEEAAVAAELAAGEIDVRELERSGELVFTGW